MKCVIWCFVSKFIKGESRINIYKSLRNHRDPFLGAIRVEWMNDSREKSAVELKKFFIPGIIGRIAKIAYDIKLHNTKGRRMVLVLFAILFKL